MKQLTETQRKNSVKTFVRVLAVGVAVALGNLLGARLFADSYLAKILITVVVTAALVPLGMFLEKKIDASDIGKKAALKAEAEAAEAAAEDDARD